MSALDPVINVYPPAGTPGWVNGAFILSGAIGGGGIAFLSVWLSDRRKFKREDKIRWDARVQEVASKYVGATWEAVVTADRVAENIEAIESEKTLYADIDRSTAAEITADNELAARVRARRNAIAEATRPATEVEGTASALLAELLMIAPGPVGLSAQELWIETLFVLVAPSQTGRDYARKSYQVKRGELITAVQMRLSSVQDQKRARLWRRLRR